MSLWISIDCGEQPMPRRNLARLYRDEFTGYSLAKFQQDLLAGLIMGLLTGAPFQISGPTGAMSAVLIVLVSRYGLEGIWVAGLLSGALLLVIGLMRLGRFIAFIPSPVISGFTSGIALIIFIGQIDNLFGITTPAAETAAGKFVGYFSGGFTPDVHTVFVGLVVIGTMLFMPKKWNARFPASLLGLIL